jgi:hypothetical protein
MQRELHTLWRARRRHAPVRCIVLTGADAVGSGSTPFMFSGMEVAVSA